jgi:hypothetical protein
VEPLVRRVLGTVVKRNEGEFDAALLALPDDETRAKSLELAVTICAFVLLDTYEGRPSPAEIRLAAGTVAEMEQWAMLIAEEVSTFLNAVLDRRPLAGTLDPQTAVMLTFIVTGSLLAASPKIGEGEWWFNYLDRVEAAIEATPGS